MSVMTSIIPPKESLVFDVRYGILKAGKLYLSIKADTFRDVPVYHITLKLKSTKHFGHFFKVDDEIHAYVTRDFHASLRYEKHIREGKYRKDLIIDYYPDSGLAVYSDGRKFEIPGNVLDPLSVVYLVRDKGIANIHMQSVNIHVDGKTSKVTITVEDSKRIKTPLGKFDAILVKPNFGDAGFFKGEMKLWLNTDHTLLPVCIETKLPIGSIKARVVEVGLK